MTIANIGEALLGVALIVWICWKQVRWTPVDIGRMWRMPLIIGVVGVVSLASTGSTLKITPTDLGLLAIELVVAVVTGVLMGWIAQFRPISEQGLAAWRVRRGDRGTAEPTVESRTGWIGVVLWVVLVAVRVGLGFWGHSLGSEIAESSGVIALVIAVNRAVRTLVFSLRHDRHLSLAAR